MGTASFSSVMLRPWISEMVDRIGRKRSYIIGCLITSVIPALYIMFHGDISGFYIPLLITRFIYGIGLAICFTASFTYVADIVPKERLNEGIGMFGATGLLGLAIGPLIAEIIMDSYGFFLFFITSSIIAGIAFFIMFFLPETYKAEIDPEEVSFFSLLKIKNILIISSVSFCFGVVIAATGNFVSPFVKEKGLAFISLYYICYSGSAIFIRISGGRLADRFGERMIIPYGLASMSIGLIILSFLRDEIILAIAGILSGCGHGLLFPSLNSLIIRGRPDSIKGKLTGLFTGSIDLGIFIGSIFLGYIGDWFGFKVLFLISSLFLLPWVIIFIKGSSYEKDSRY